MSLLRRFRLLESKRLIGILSVASYQTRDFKKDKRLLGLFADHMSLAMKKHLLLTLQRVKNVIALWLKISIWGSL